MGKLWEKIKVFLERSWKTRNTKSNLKGDMQNSEEKLLEQLENIKKMKGAFEKAVNFVLKWEGGYSNTPNDPGGETKYGISKRSYPDVDIKNLTLEQAKEIYRRDFWRAGGCDNLEFPLDAVVLDTAVNCGVERAKKFLGEASDWKDYLLRRVQYYTRLKGARYFLKGWVNRVVDLYNMIKESKNA